MTCRVYVGEYQDRITGGSSNPHVVIDENGRLVKAMAQKVKTNKGLSLQAVKLAVQGLCYLHGMDEAMLCMDSPTALAALRQECPPKGSRRKITEIRHRLAAIPYPVTLELAIGSRPQRRRQYVGTVRGDRKKYCSPTARQYALLVSTL